MKGNIIRPVVLCGGYGTRLWPLSTPERPKQFLRLLGDRTMLEVTLSRVTGAAGAGLSFTAPLVIGSEGHEALIRESASEAAVLLEPAGRNSAAPVAAAALTADPDDLVLVMPADHDIRDVGAFHDAIARGAEAALSGAVVTFGILPTHPATGYGYIESRRRQGDVLDAERFVEKPDRETAQAYLESGRFFWNAGIFLFRARDMIAAFRAHASDILDAVSSALPEERLEAGQTARLSPDKFNMCRSQSVDHAIMEHLAGLKVVPADMGWSDIGDFRALWERSDKDGAGNAIIGDVRLENCRDCYVHAAQMTVSLASLDKAVIIARDGHVMICGMEGAQSVKALARE